MRVKYFHHGLWPSASPSTTFVTWNCLGFAELSADFELVTVRNSPRDVPDTLAEEFGISTPLRIRLLSAGIFRRSHRIVHFLAFCHLLLARWDAVITRNLGFLPWAWLLQRLRGGTVVFESHDFFSEPSRSDRPPGRSARKQAARERRWIPRVDGVVCVSEQQRAYYRECYPNQHFLTAVTGVKRPTRRDGPRRPGAPLVGYVGTFDADRYDIDLILRAIGLVQQPGARLIMVGARNDADAVAMRERAAALGVLDRVDILPWQPPAALEAIKETLAIGLAPLAISERNQIGSPLKVLEYLSAGIPVVGSDLRGIRAILDTGPCGLVSESRAAAWAGAIDRILGEPALADSLSKHAMARAEELSWDRRARRVLDFLAARRRT